MLVRDIMNKSVITISKDSSILNAAKLMRENNIGILPVTENGSVIGVITDRDITTRAVILPERSDALTVSDFLSPSTAFISPESTLGDAARLMSTLQIKRLLVMENGKLCGIISLSDIMKKSKDGEFASAVCEIFDV